MRKRRDLVKFRHSGAVIAAAIIGLFGALPLGLSSWYLAPVLLIPLVIGLWAARVGVDATLGELKIKGLLGSQKVMWADVSGFTALDKRVSANLSHGSSIFLPAVRPTDVPRLIAAGNQQFTSSESDSAGEIAHERTVTLAR